MTIAVLIVNWNSGPLLAECLQALRRQVRAPDHVIVVDNASSDGSMEVAARFLRDAEVIRLGSNVGFARANNLAARAAARFDALALLNPDAFAEPEWLRALTEAAACRPEFAAFASQMRLASAPERLDGAGDSYHVSGRAWRVGHGSPAAEWRTGDSEVFAACAAAALYRRGPFEEVGGFDERYFCYFEDVDLGFRLRLRGYRCLYVHAAVVRHVSSASAGYRGDFAVYHGERNAVWTWVKNMPAPLLWLYLPQHLLLNAAALAYYAFRGQGLVALRAKFDALKGLPETLRDRRAVQRARRVSVRELRRAMSRGLAAPYLARYSGIEASGLAPRPRSHQSALAGSPRAGCSGGSARGRRAS
ncbi:MAG TPA: glycosyltransferase family 2 protein [Vicinamibacterales bacterium]|nr:glycosyltransferase family 2 protein [Vicinamibacterales bacterium]